MKCFCSVFIILLLLCSWMTVVEAQDETVTVEITDLPEGAQGGAFEVTITFSEAVVNFETDDIAFSDASVDASVTNLTTPDEGEEDHKKVYTAEITPADDVAGDLTFGVAENVVKSANADVDAEDNNSASESYTVEVDLVPPVVSITNVPEVAQNAAFDITITFSEPVNDFGASGITVRGPATASLKSGSDGDSVYEITITPETTSEGDVTFHIPEAVVQDGALNDNTVSDSHTVHIDTRPPTVEITDVPDIGKNVPFDVTITFSEPVNGFTVDDITLTGPAVVTLEAGEDGASAYTAKITPNTASEGDVTVQINANTVKDFALNENSASNKPEGYIDTLAPTVESITGIPTIQKNVDFDITITFSEAVKDFAANSVIGTGPATASVKSAADGDTVYEITITPNATSEGDVILQVPADAATDLAQNGNEASTKTATVRIDTIPPTVESITGIPTIQKNVDFDITITFSEAVKDFAANSVIRTGPATASVKSVADGDTVYQVTITPRATSEGDVILKVPAGAATDLAQNPNTASTETDPVRIDTRPPTVESITGIPTIEKNVAFDITITFSEAVKNFAANSVIHTGPATASLKSVADGDTVYQVTITPRATSEGDVILKVPAGAATDLAQNGNEASTETATVRIDTIPPTVESITGIPTIEKNVAFDITITFSEAVKNFAANSVIHTGPATASVKSVADGDTVYQVTITPRATSEGDVILKVPAGAATDLAQNGNEASTETATVRIDTRPPTVESITGIPTIEKNVAFDITITFSEAVKNFAANSVIHTGPATASVKSVADGDTVYQVTITPRATSEGDVILKVPAGAATDLAQNPNTASTETDPVRIDTRPPTVESITGIPTIEKNVAFDITITFSEAVKNFAANSVIHTGPATASLKSVADGDTVYQVTITPRATSEGDVILKVPAGAATDLAQNGNEASTETATVRIDTIPPTVESITGIPTIEKNVAFDITITFSEAVKNFAANSVIHTGPATASLKSVADGDTVYQVTITPRATSEGDVILKVPAGAATDLAQNGNEASTETATVRIDTIPPTVESITGIPTIEKNVAFDITITFSEAVKNFAANSVIHTGPATASLKSVADGDTVYQVTITPRATSEGDVILKVPAGAATDLAQNPNTASTETASVHIDTRPPTVEITEVPVIEKNEAFDIIITFSEEVNGFRGSDIRLTGPATLSLKEGADGDSVYKVTITPKPTSEDAVEFHVPAAAAKDFALNNNIISAKHPVHIDTIPPEVSITPVPGNTDVFDAVQFETFYLQIVFSEDVLEFEVEAIPLTGDAVVRTSELTGGGRTSVLTIIPHADTDGTVIVKVASGITKDNANNLNKASAERRVYVAPKWIPDPNIRAVVREEMGLIKGEDFDQDRLKDLVTLEAGYREIIDVTGLEYATNLTNLSLEGNFVTDLSPFRDLTELTILALKGNRITDLTPLQGLTRLKSLDLRENIISDLEPLTGLVSLTDLYLTTNQISDVSPLAELSNLVTLWISENPIKNAASVVGLAETIEADIAVPNLVVDPALRDAIRAVLGIDSSKRVTLSALQTLTALQAELKGIRTLMGLEHATALTTLELNGNSIVDMTPIRGLTRLTTLNLSNNAIVDITPLAGFTALTVLNLSNNPLGNLETLTALGELTVLELSGISLNNLEVISRLIGLLELNISNNSIINITPLQKLRALTALDLSNNPIGNLNVISSFPWLRRLELSGNSITDLTPLASLGRLTTLILGSNSISVLAPITSLTNLKVLDLNNNSVSDVGPLTALTRLETLNLSANIVSNVEPFAALINLATLRLAENPILDTTALYPLTQRVPPVNIDISVSRYPPWDVNQDGRVNASDSVLVAAALGQSGADIVLQRTDVNGDGSVDNADVLLVTENFDEEAAGAPSTVDILAGLDPLDREMLEAQLEILIAESDGSLKYLRTIALLQSLLAELHPDKTRLFTNYPNPFNPETWIPYQLANSSDVQIFIYDVHGAVIHHLNLGYQVAGYYISRKHAAYWDGRNAMGESVASGIYFYQLQTERLSLLRKMLILK